MAVFKFHLQDLERVHRRNRRDHRRELGFLQKQFHEWDVNQNEAVVLDKETLQKVITTAGTKQEDSARLLVEWADKLGAIFKATKLSSSQLRDFFGEARQIQQQGFESARSRRRFILLLPKLEYAAARANVFGMDGLRDVLAQSIRFVQDDPQNFQRFMEFFEAILAYHKAYGGS